MYETVIGLEVHVQLGTQSKVFCADDARFGGAPNTHVSAISLAHPGTLPRLNRRAIEHAVKLGLALGSEINLRTAFDRKNYFYADLPKGYQITQDRRPVCLGGKVDLADETAGVKTIRIHHIHLEEDAGKSIHDQEPYDSLIDLNRAGVPLLEIVSEPDLRSAEETTAYVETIRRLVRWLDISDGNMEEGSLRCDVNISVRRFGDPQYGKRCEIKNVNSMRFARKAIEYEVARQIALLEKGEKVIQETRGFDPADGTTYSLREKEDAHDYRYFPEPDLPPVVFSQAEIDAMQAALPPLPEQLFAQFQQQYDLPAYDAGQLTQERSVAGYFMALAGDNLATGKAMANLIVNKLKPWADEKGMALTDIPVSPQGWQIFAKLIADGQLSASTAYQRLFPALMERPDADPAYLAAELDLLQSADADWLTQIVDGVVAKFPEKVAEYRKGKKGLQGFFMGEIMKAAQGKADPQATTKLLLERINQ